ncbi:MAG: hypothetical protein MJ050_06605, partial [Phascolarctobacterium sp.]|nr:hypothetical protein [Phascolarctobacterium sp.]
QQPKQTLKSRHTLQTERPSVLILSSYPNLQVLLSTAFAAHTVVAHNQYLDKRKGTLVAGCLK